MSLNIKNEETHRLVRQLANITGESMTAAVDKAVRERLERLRVKSKEGMAEKLMKIARSSGPLWKKPYISLEELLYDEKGLPKGLK
ncbi:MAG: type II toxin-antitoxin system VapB family antitoxin [Candidatus Sulfotelmatobacter sp.]|jgi:antitoxin VapB